MNTQSKMNAHTKLKLHLERHMYKRGPFQGDAPADSSRRGKNHFRVVKGNGGQMIVRMHNADLITAYEDGRLILDTEGWHGSPTTKACMNDALHAFVGWGGIGSVRKWGVSATCIRAQGKTYRYYDGMEFSAEGDLLTPPKTFMAKRVDRDATAEFRADVAQCGFADVFPVLYAASEWANGTQTWLGHKVSSIVSHEHHSNEWPLVVALLKFPTWYARQHNNPYYPDHKAAWKALMASCTKNMTLLVDTGVTVM